MSSMSIRAEAGVSLLHVERPVRTGSALLVKRGQDLALAAVLTLLAVPPDTEIAVVEIGTNTPGEIDALRRIAEPDVTVMTSIGEEHLEGLGDLAGVLREESHAFDGVALAIVPASQPEVADAARGRARSVVRAGLDAGDPRPSGQQSKISIALKEGITTEDAKKVGKLIRDEGPKGVKVQVQGDELRVSSKKRDDLQAVQQLVKSQDYDFAVQFTNYR